MSFIEFHTTKRYAKFINKNNFSWSESTGNAISVYFLKLCEIFKNFQKFFISLDKTRKAKAASGRLSFKGGYNQRCQWYQNLPLDIPKLHAKFHQNPWCGFGEKCGQDNDNV